MNESVFFETIQNHFEKDSPFVVYRKPKQQELKAVLQDNSEIYSAKTFSEDGFVFSPFESINDNVFFPLNESEIISINEYSDIEFESEIVENEINLEAKNHHIQIVKNAVEVIGNSNLQKVVLSRCERVKISENNPISIFKRLLTLYKNAFVYCWFHPKIGLWLGATPETLISVRHQNFKTMALAGTINSEENWQEKEQYEQQIVTESIVEALKPFSDNVKVSEVNTITAGNLLHLQTAISGVFNKKDVDLKSVVKSLHPTPAVGGFPKQKAKEYILKNESYNREFYTGFLGELNFTSKKQRNSNRRNVENNAYDLVKTTSDLYVNLRCTQIKTDKALIYVGGGITIDSNPEKEWKETVNKTQTIKRVLV